MRASRRSICALAATVLCALTCGLAGARELDAPIEMLSRIAAPLRTRLDGSGLLYQSIGDTDGTRHRLRMLSLRVQVAPRAVLRAGLGMARHNLLPFQREPQEEGLAMSALVSLDLWHGQHFGLDLSVSGLRAAYQGHANNDLVVVLAVRVL